MRFVQLYIQCTIVECILKANQYDGSFLSNFTQMGYEVVFIGVSHTLLAFSEIYCSHREKNTDPCMRPDHETAHDLKVFSRLLLQMLHILLCWEQLFQKNKNKQNRQYFRWAFFFGVQWSSLSIAVVFPSPLSVSRQNWETLFRLEENFWPRKKCKQKHENKKLAPLLGNVVICC